MEKLGGKNASHYFFQGFVRASAQLVSAPRISLFCFLSLPPPPPPPPPHRHFWKTLFSGEHKGRLHSAVREEGRGEGGQEGTDGEKDGRVERSHRRLEHHGAGRPGGTNVATRRQETESGYSGGGGRPVGITFSVRPQSAARRPLRKRFAALSWSPQGRMGKGERVAPAPVSLRPAASCQTPVVDGGPRQFSTQIGRAHV